jgi:hypothetical protein
VAFSDLQGALVNLKLVEPGAAAKLLPAFAGEWDDEPDVEALKRRLAKRSVVVWELHPISGRGSRGHVGYINTDSPRIFVDVKDVADAPLVQDALLALLPVFFGNTREEWLFFHIERQYEDLVRDFLVESGFDPIEAPFYDPKQYQSFVLRRETYDIYYGEGGGDDDAELDDAELEAEDD